MQRIQHLFNHLQAVWLAPVCIALMLIAPTPGAAQNADIQTLTQRIERLQRDLRELQKDYYRGQKSRAPGAATEADKAVAPGGASSGGQLANAEIRMSNLETEMRLLTGQLEEVRHGIQTVLQRLDGLVKDVDFRLTEIERGRTGTKTMPSSPPSNGAAGPNTDDKADNRADNEAAGQVAANAPPPSVLPKGTPMERYNYAYSLLLKVRLDEAEAAFQEFLAKHGDDKLAGNAQFWLGQTYFTQERYSDAARTFLAGIDRYPKSNKAPDTWLKLGITLGKLDQKEEACAAFLEMRNLFSNLRAQVEKRLRRETRLAGCN
ncbi:MAG: tol-pal system protein YbgF [Rhodospirillaceae bacterium]|jgi:tol-pal system protein YbgF|nr:tol-pal system protein YbgF [Rhodospirillaceae bacterium]MBT3494225.1 tol-pal system protein YbgF [Rhodospirillaceae bacterium]MBT3781543.1 tol-pal system protein YbgF [Rhodospirillaceae bacterium]MBT3979234.1 tol-pal system protein YbgF [Rhodospirillaceae bacterium]MBT4169912.1 tol-pal system protein YbgF [Rhodospirillaceae bacterium]